MNLEPNEEDWDGPYWSPWQALGLLSAYSSTIDEHAIGVLKGIRDKKFNTDIAAELELPTAYVELLQTIFCNADWCDYGTSPRGCWPSYELDFDALIAAWEAYFQRHWVKEQPS